MAYVDEVMEKVSTAGGKEQLGIAKALDDLQKRMKQSNKLRRDLSEARQDGDLEEVTRLRVRFKAAQDEVKASEERLCAAAGKPEGANAHDWADKIRTTLLEAFGKNEEDA